MYVGIDIDGTNMRIGLFRLIGKNLQLVKEYSYSVDQDFTKGIDRIIQSVKDLSRVHKIDGVGIGVPGIVNVDEGVILVANNLQGWENRPLKAALEEKLKIKVKVNQDVVLAALAEAATKDTKEAKFIYFIWGTGIGGAVVERILGKLHIYPFEPGHQVINWNEEIRCSCKQKGCLEMYLGGNQIEKHFGKKPADIGSTVVWNRIAGVMSQGLLNTIHMHPTNLVVFGGGLISKQVHLLKRINRILNKRLINFPVPKMKIASHGERSGLYGSVEQFFVNLI